jgi:hypothetical protein
MVKQYNVEELKVLEECSANAFELASLLHDVFCKHDHAEACFWHYYKPHEHWDQGVKLRYLDMAYKLIFLFSNENLKMDTRIALLKFFIESKKFIY